MEVTDLGAIWLLVRNGLPFAVEIILSWLEIMLYALVKPSSCITYFLSEIYFLQGTCFVNGYYQFITGAALYSKVSQLWHFWHLGQDDSLLGMLGVVGGAVLAHSVLLSNTPGLYSLDATKHPPTCDNQKCLQVLPNDKRN